MMAGRALHERTRLGAAVRADPLSAFLVAGLGHVHEELLWIDRNLVAVLFDPLGGPSVQRALRVVALGRRASPQTRWIIAVRASPAPMIADADGVRRDVRMENRREHAEQRCLARVSLGEGDLEAMLVRDLDLDAAFPKGPHLEHETIPLR